MFVFPFQVEFRLVRLPVVTLLVCLLCLGVFVAQRSSEARWRDAVTFSCDHADEALLWLLSKRSSVATGVQCRQIAAELLASSDPAAQIAATATDWSDRPYAASLGGRDGIARTLSAYAEALFQLGGPLPLTARLVYPPRSWNPWRMVTATLAHASWGHLLGNLFFFYLFGGTVEAVLGMRRYLGFLLGLAIGTHLSYSLATLGTAAPPSLGLSGLVYGVLALFAYCLPDARIRSVYVLFTRVGLTSLSAWFVALWYVGGDVLLMLVRGNHGGVNLVAHVSGAVIAILLGMTLFKAERDHVREEAKPYLRPDF